MKYKRNIYIALTILTILVGCTSTTKKSDSDVDRIQLMILPEYMALNMSQSGYTEILDEAKKDGILNTDTIQVERVREISYNLINQTYIFREDAQDWKNSVFFGISSIRLPEITILLIPRRLAINKINAVT